MKRRFYTIGHSTRSTEAFIELLEGCGVVTLADVRAIPRSRSNPQFESTALSRSLAAHDIGYTHLASLGGLRRRNPEVADDVNGLWKNRSFHNFADYALGEEFAHGLDDLRALGELGPCAIMCAEAVWWRCHRRIIADHLLHRGEQVEHILGPGKVHPATLTPGARADSGGPLVYPAAGADA